MMKSPILYSILFVLINISFLNASPLDDAIKIINTKDDEISMTMNREEDTIIFSRRVPGGKASLYISRYSNGKWTTPEIIKELSAEDSDDRSPFLSKDGNFILFSSDRSESLEDETGKSRSYDIYYSEKIDGKWSEPLQIFGAINTKADEFNPYLSADEKTLIFTRGKINLPNRSKVIKVENKDDFWQDAETFYIPFNDTNRNYMYRDSVTPGAFFLSAFDSSGTGKRDIVMVRGTTKENMEIINPGKSINTTGDEISIWETKNRELIVSSNFNGISGSYDFRIIKTEPVLSEKDERELVITIKNINDFSSPPRLKALLFDTPERTAAPVKSGILYPDKSGTVRVAPDNNIKRILIIPADDNTEEFIAEYIFGSKKKISGSIVLKSRKGDEPFRVKPVFFRYNSSEIQVHYIPYLYRLVEELRQSPEKKILLRGYADGTGNRGANLRMGMKRAERIKKYLTSMGIDSKRIIVEKTGDHRRSSSKSTDQNSRRVNFKFGE